MSLTRRGGYEIQSACLLSTSLVQLLQEFLVASWASDPVILDREHCAPQFILLHVLRSWFANWFPFFVNRWEQEASETNFKSLFRTLFQEVNQIEGIGIPYKGIKWVRSRVIGDWVHEWVNRCVREKYLSNSQNYKSGCCEEKRSWKKESWPRLPLDVNLQFHSRVLNGE